jgi:hypothetical protein
VLLAATNFSPLKEGLDLLLPVRDYTAGAGSDSSINALLHQRREGHDPTGDYPFSVLPHTLASLQALRTMFRDCVKAKTPHSRMVRDAVREARAQMEQRVLKDEKSLEAELAEDEEPGVVEARDEYLKALHAFASLKYNGRWQTNPETKLRGISKASDARLALDALAAASTTHTTELKRARARGAEARKALAVARGDELPRVVPRWERDDKLAECVDRLEHSKYMLSVAEKGVEVVDKWTDISEPVAVVAPAADVAASEKGGWSSWFSRFW